MKMKFITILFLLPQIILLNVVNFTMAEPIYSEIFRCRNSSGTYAPNSPYKTNLMSALNTLPGAYNRDVGDKPNEKVSAESVCAGYSTIQSCASCYNKTIQMILQKCPNHKAAAAWRVSCMVQYGPPTTNNYDLWYVVHEVSEVKVSDPADLERSLTILGESLWPKVWFTRPKYNFGTKPGKTLNDKTLYMHMQCINRIENIHCTKCLVEMLEEMKSRSKGAMAAAVLTPKCFIRYAHSDFRALTS